MFHVLLRDADQRVINVQADNRLGLKVAANAQRHVADINIQAIFIGKPLLLHATEYRE